MLRCPFSYYVSGSSPHPRPNAGLLLFGLVAFCLGAIAPLSASANCTVLPPQFEFSENALTTDDYEKRVAFVVGNSNYLHSNKLLRASSDAEAVSRRLQQLGFAVIQAIDLDETSLQNCRQTLSGLLVNADIGAFYYAGHGMQVTSKDEITGAVNARNYLVTIDGNVVEGVASGFIQVDDIISDIRENSRATLAFLDSCRENPLSQKSISRVGSTRALNSADGLAELSKEEIASRPGLLIAYATSPNKLALDDSGGHSPYTQALLDHLGAPGASIQQTMSYVSSAVGDVTSGYQTPWTSSSLVEEVFLNGRLDIEEALLLSKKYLASAYAAHSENDRMSAIALAIRALPYSAARRPPDADDPFAEAYGVLHGLLHNSDLTMVFAKPEKETPSVQVLGYAPTVNPDKFVVIDRHLNTGASMSFLAGSGESQSETENEQGDSGVDSLQMSRSSIQFLSNISIRLWDAKTGQIERSLFNFLIDSDLRTFPPERFDITTNAAGKIAVTEKEDIIIFDASEEGFERIEVQTLLNNGVSPKSSLEICIGQMMDVLSQSQMEFDQVRQRAEQSCIELFDSNPSYKEFYRLQGEGSNNSDITKLEISDIHFVPGKPKLIFGTVGGAIHELDLSNRAVRTFQAGHEGAIVEVEISGDASSVATIGTDRSARVWSADDLSVVWSPEIPNEAHPVFVTLNQSGKLVAIGDTLGRITVWAVGEAKPIASFQTQAKMDEQLQQMLLRYSNFSEDYSIQREQGILGIYRAQSLFFSAAFSPDSDFLAVSDSFLAAVQKTGLTTDLALNPIKVYGIPPNDSEFGPMDRMPVGGQITPIWSDGDLAGLSYSISIDEISDLWAQKTSGLELVETALGYLPSQQREMVKRERIRYWPIEQQKRLRN